METCPICHGTGKYVESSPGGPQETICFNCGGSGTVGVQKDVEPSVDPSRKPQPEKRLLDELAKAALEGVFYTTESEVKRYRNKIYIRIGSFGFEAGWYSGQEPVIVSGKLLEFMHGYLCILYLQVWKFTVSAWVDTDPAPVAEKEVMA